MLTNHVHFRRLIEKIFLASYYPGRGQTTHPLASFPTVPQGFDPENGDDSGVESEGEWLNDSQLAELAKGPPSRISEALANEVRRQHFLWFLNSQLLWKRPSWQGPPSADNPSMPMVPPSVDVTASTPTLSPLVDVTRPASTTSPSWPAETDLILTPGSDKIKLTKQQDLVHTVVHDSFETLRAALLLDNAFPNPSLQASFVRDALLSSAKAHMPDAASILMRLQKDMIYLRKLLPVVSPFTFELG